jgi:outer membrane receptor protein involved in Fe transport
MIRFQSKHAVSAALALLFAQGFAQTVNRPPATKETETAAPKEEEIVHLDPFSVVGSDDKGYQAQSSLAGTRLRTSLKDIATPISSFTDQFFRDTAITDTSDLARFMLSTEYDVGENDGAQNNPMKGDTRPLRVRGVQVSNEAAAPSVNFFKFAGRIDTFSTERVDQSRGPNSVLFGMGSPAGIVNVTTKRAMLNNNAAEITIAGKSWGGLREVVDFNQVIIKDRLAVRVAAVRDDQNSWRNYEYNDNDRYFGTMKWKIGPHTELNIEGERGQTDKATKRPFTAYDDYTPWRDAGKPISATAVTGVQVLSTAPYLVYDTTSGALMNWRNKTTSKVNTTVDGTNTVLTDFSILPKETSIYGPGFNQLDDYDRLTLMLTHEFTRHVNLELGAFRYDNRSGDFDPQTSSGLALQVDTNPTLPTGAPNPNAGKTYLEGLPQTNTKRTRDDAVRGSLAVDHDFGRIFGKHTLVGVFQYSHQNLEQWLTREQVLVNPPNTATPENNQNRVWRRTYVDITGPSTGIVMADYRLQPSISGLKELVGGQTMQSDWIPFNANTQINSNRLKSGIATLQSSFWDDRIHTVIGASRDQRVDYYGTQLRTALAPFTGGGILYPVPGTVPFKNTANSVSFSGVVRTTDWLYLTYSQAANAGLPSASGQLHTPTGRPPIPRGRSQDIGIKLDLFNHRLFLTAAHFQSSAKQDFDFTGVLAATINPIWTSLDTAGVLKANNLTIDQVTDRTTGSTHDTASEGYEFEMTVNPTENWRIYANYTNNRTTLANIGQEMVDYVSSQRDFWTKNGAVVIPGGSGTTATTVAQQVAIIDNAIFQQFVVQDGKEPLGQIRNKFNLRTGYDFSSDSLKGFSVGGGVRYLGRNLLQFVVTTDASHNVTRTPGYGTDQVFVDVNVGYTKKLQVFHRSVRWSLQLNVNNVLNNDAFVRLRENTSGQLVSYKFNTPLEWIVTNRFAF